MPVSWARSSWPPVDVPASNVPVLIYTAHTTHSLTSPPATHSPIPLQRRAPAADTFLVPARSPRKTRPSRQPPWAARSLVRPTSFMRATTPRSPPAKAPRTTSRLRCAQSLHECGQKAASSLYVLVAKGTRMWPPRHVCPCLHPTQPCSPNELTAER
jgi:hypothetical protein